MNTNHKSKEHLYDLIVTTKAFDHHDKLIRLASGKETPYYFDIKKLTGLPEGIHQVAQVLYDIIMRIGDIKSVGGLESGSISISTAISQLSHLTNKDTSLQSFYVRKVPKERGLGKQIEGCVKSPTVVVDDVITTGESALKAIRAIRNEGNKVDYLITIVYRGTEEEKRKLESENNIKLIYVFMEKDFTEKYEKENSGYLTH